MVETVDSIKVGSAPLSQLLSSGGQRLLGASALATCCCTHTGATPTMPLIHYALHRQPAASMVQLLRHAACLEVQPRVIAACSALHASECTAHRVRADVGHPSQHPSHTGVSPRARCIMKFSHCHCSAVAVIRGVALLGAHRAMQVMRAVIQETLADLPVFVRLCPRAAQLAERLEKAAAAAGRAEPLGVMVQVNTSGEESKFGLQPDACVEVARHIKEQCPNLRWRGRVVLACSACVVPGCGFCRQHCAIMRRCWVLHRCSAASWVLPA
jgi:hypothetical protein